MKRKYICFAVLIVFTALILHPVFFAKNPASAAPDFTDSFYHTVKYDDAADEAEYSAGWTGKNDGSCYETTYSEAEAGAALRFDFSGTAIRIFGGKYATGGGTFRILIDNANRTDLSNEGAGGLSEKLYERTGLTDGGHILEVQVLSGKFSVDYFEVTENLPAERAVVSFVKESNLVFNNLWGYKGNGTLSDINDGNLYYSSETGASFTFTFSGIGFALFTEVNPISQDIIRVEIDGALYRDNWGQEPLPSSTRGDYSANFRVYGLAQDTHTVRVTKCSDNKFRFITLEAICIVADSKYVIPEAPRLSGYTRQVDYTVSEAPFILEGGWNSSAQEIVSDPGADESTLSITFSGEGFTLYGSAPSGVALRLYLDNKYHGVISPANGILAAIKGLAVAGHRVKAVITDAGVTVTGLTISEDVPYDCIGLQTVMDDELQFEGSWQAARGGISNGTTRYSSAANAYFTFTFTGIGFEIVAEKSSA